MALFSINLAEYWQLADNGCKRIGKMEKWLFLPLPSFSVSLSFLPPSLPPKLANFLLKSRIFNIIQIFNLVTLAQIPQSSPKNVKEPLHPFLLILGRCNDVVIKFSWTLDVDSWKVHHSTGLVVFEDSDQNLFLKGTLQSSVLLLNQQKLVILHMTTIYLISKCQQINN